MTVSVRRSTCSSSKVLLGLILTLVPATLCLGQSPSPRVRVHLSRHTPEPVPVTVTYVSNAGFLITVGDKKILIDALYSLSNYDPPLDAQRRMTLAQPPFDGVDLVLATHNHSDHFDASMVRLHLSNNPRAIFGSTSQATASLSDLSARVVTFEAATGVSMVRNIAGMNVEAIYLSHGRFPEGQVEIVNYGFVVTVNGVTFFHTGDVDYDNLDYDVFRGYNLSEKKIDLAFIHHYYLESGSTYQRFVRDGIGGKYIIPMHLGGLPRPDFEAILLTYPGAVVFSQSLQTWTMPR